MEVQRQTTAQPHIQADSYIPPPKLRLWGYKDWNQLDSKQEGLIMLNLVPSHLKAACNVYLTQFEET